MSDLLPRKRLPRDRAGHTDLPAETGPIVRMIPNEGFLEIYATHGTYRVQTPDNLDPDRKVPNMPWAQKKASDVGSSNPIVARVFLQAHDALDQAKLTRGNAKTLLSRLHACKEELVACEFIYLGIKKEHERIEKLIRERTVSRKGSAVECPQISDLSRLATNFLTGAKRAIQAVGEVFNDFYAPPKGNKVKNGNFGFAVKHLKKLDPSNSGYLEFLKHFEPAVKVLVELRNGQEHPEPGSMTVVENFDLGANGFVVPRWGRTPEPLRPILPEMKGAIDCLIQFAELNFFFGLMDHLDGMFPQMVVDIPVGTRDANCPIRFRLEYDLKRNSQPQESP